MRDTPEALLVRQEQDEPWFVAEVAIAGDAVPKKYAGDANGLIRLIKNLRLDAIRDGRR